MLILGLMNGLKGFIDLLKPYAEHGYFSEKGLSSLLYILKGSMTHVL